MSMTWMTKLLNRGSQQDRRATTQRSEEETARMIAGLSLTERRYPTPAPRRPRRVRTAAETERLIAGLSMTERRYPTKREAVGTVLTASDRAGADESLRAHPNRVVSMADRQHGQLSTR